jgi:hypothetical protein
LTPLTGASVVALLRDGTHSNVELRKNLTFRERWSLYTYRLTDARGGPVNHRIRDVANTASPQLASSSLSSSASSSLSHAPPPQRERSSSRNSGNKEGEQLTELKLYPKNFTGQVWDLFQKIGFWRSGLWVTNAVQLSSGEMFVQKRDFEQLIDDITVSE